MGGDRTGGGGGAIAPGCGLWFYVSLTQVRYTLSLSQEVHDTVGWLPIVKETLEFCQHRLEM
jgi:hypothetical protein